MYTLNGDQSLFYPPPLKNEQDPGMWFDRDKANMQDRPCQLQSSLHWGVRFIQGTTSLPSSGLCKEWFWPGGQIDPSGYKQIAVIRAGKNCWNCWRLSLLGSLLPSSLVQFITVLNSEVSILSNTLSCPKHHVSTLWQTWKESRNRQWKCEAFWHTKAWRKDQHSSRWRQIPEDMGVLYRLDNSTGKAGSVVYPWGKQEQSKSLLIPQAFICSQK